MVSRVRGVKTGEGHKDKCVLPTVKHGGGESWSETAWMLPALGSYKSLRETWTLIFTATYWSRGWFPAVWATGQYSRMIMTFKTPPRWLLLCLRDWGVKVMDWSSRYPDLNPKPYLWGILKWKVQEHNISNVRQLCDVIMEEWKRTPVATCKPLVNSMPRRVKAVLDNHDGQTKYDTEHFHLGVSSLLNKMNTEYFSLCDSRSVVPWQEIHKWPQKCERCFTLVRYYISVVFLFSFLFVFDCLIPNPNLQNKHNGVMNRFISPCRRLLCWDSGSRPPQPQKDFSWRQQLLGTWVYQSMMPSLPVRPESSAGGQAQRVRHVYVFTRGKT